MLNLFAMKDQLKDMKSVRFMEDPARDVTIVCYMVDDVELWKHPLGLECRGSVFDNKTGRCLCRPFEKFFNFHEMTTEHQKEIEHQINSGHGVAFTVKRDGSMITPVLLPSGELDFKTKKSFDSDVAKLAKEYVTRSFPMLLEWCKDWLVRGYTPIFEFTSPDSEIVLSYGEEPTITLLALRNIVSGQYLPLNFDEVGGPAVIDYIPFHSTDQLKEAQSHAENEEGWVAELLDLKSLNSIRVKFKTQWYVDRHRLLDLRERDVADAVIEDKIDDLRDSMIAAGADPKKLYEIQAKVVGQLTFLMGSAVDFHNKAKNAGSSNKKEVALFAIKYCKEYMPIIMALHESNQSKAERNMKKLWENIYREEYKLRSIVNEKFGEQDG